MISLQNGKERLSILCFADAIALRLQTPSKELANFGIVVDNQYMGLGHAGAVPIMQKILSSHEAV